VISRTRLGVGGGRLHALAQPRSGSILRKKHERCTRMTMSGLDQSHNGNVISLTLLGGFGISADGEDARLPPGSQRVLAALALRSPCDRGSLAATLYPDGEQAQVSASLRSALWRAQKELGPLFTTCGQQIALSDNTDVDIHSWVRWARDLERCPTDVAGDHTTLVDVLSRRLLPSWDEDWLVFDQQRWDQLRMHALELLADSLCREGRYSNAVEAGLAAVAVEPYRESARRALVKVYLAEGNVASAVRHYKDYQSLLARDLGVRPTAQLKALMRDVLSA